MAYRRRQGLSRISTRRNNQDDDDPTIYVTTSSCYSPSSSLASQALRASAARRDSNIYAKSSPQGPTYDYTSFRTTNDQSGGFWSVLARKAKSVLDEDSVHEQITRPNQIPYGSTFAPNDQYYDPRKSHEYSRPIDNPPFRKGLDAFTSSINQIGGTIGNVLEDGRSKVENRTSDIHKDTQHMHTRRKGTDQEEHAHVSSIRNPWQEHQTNASQQRTQTNQQTQLKASRDVAMATAAKAKLLLRELKTVKADLAFSKQRCSQLEEENKMLREANEKGDHPADDDMIRLQLETLLAEKARLAHENSVYARENRFLREIVEYHQLTMQDVVYLDDEEVTEVYPLSRMLSDSPPALQSPSPERSPSRSPPPVENGNFHAPTTMQTRSSQSNTQTRVKSNDTAPAATQLQAFADVLENEAPTSSASSVSSTEASGQRNSSAA